MIPLLLLFVVAVRVYKKTTPNGKLTVYLSKRDYIDHCDGNVDPVEGVVYVDKDYLKGRRVYSQMDTIYRFGREEDEVMGIKFSKEYTLHKAQVTPPLKEKRTLSKVQEKLINKLGSDACAFTFQFPDTSPSSVTVQSGEEQPVSKPLGVEYRIRTYVAETVDEQPRKRSMVNLVIKKLQYAPAKILDRLPSGMGTKSFTFSQGKVIMEVTLDKEVYYHGEKIEPIVAITNNSSKSVKNIKVAVIQHVELTMVNNHLENQVAILETREGCPITPSHTYRKTFSLQPLATYNKDKRGIALDGHLKDDDVNLASSTIYSQSKPQGEALGVVVSYTVKAKITFGTLGGDLQVDVPMKLVHQQPSPITTKPKDAARALKRIGSKSVDRAHYEDSCYAQDDEENMVFEDLARHRMSEAED